MRLEVFDLDVPVEGNGAARDVDDLTGLTVSIAGTFTATVAVEGSIDGSAWHQVASDPATTSPASGPASSRSSTAA